MSFIRSYIYLITFIGIIFFGVVVRFYQLGAIPYGLNNDETAIGYNAYSILTTGKDEYGRAYPLYFTSFGDNKLPVYIYSTTLAIKALGATPLAVRVTSAIFGVVGIIAIYVLIHVIAKNRLWATFAALLLAINPWNIFFSRTGFEVNVATTLMLIGTLFYFLWIKQYKLHNFYLIFTPIAFILSAYSYNATRVLAPVMFFSFTGFFYFTKKISIREIIKISTLFMIGMIPFGISFLQDTRIAAQTSLLLTGGESRAKVLELRSYINLKPDILSRIFFSSPSLYFWNYAKNIVSFFSANFFFINGAQHPINGVTNFGMFHLFEVVTIPLGIFIAIKKKIVYLYPFLIWAFWVIILGSITIETPHATRSYAIVVPLIIFSAYGLFLVVSYIKNFKNKLLRNGLLIAGLTFILYSLSLYLAIYFFYFPTVYARDWRAKDQELTQLIQNLEKDYERVIIDERANYVYTSFLFYSKYPAAKLHKTEKYGKNGLLTTLKSFDKFEYRNIDPGKDKDLANTLIVASADTVMDASQIREFLLPTQKKVMFYDNNFLEVPVQETVYRVYSTKR